MKKLLTLLQKKLSIGRTPRGYRWINYVMWAYAAVWMLYIAGWLFNFWRLRQADLPALISLGQLMVSPAAAAAFIVFLRSKTDADHDGVPDSAEDKKGGLL